MAPKSRRLGILKFARLSFLFCVCSLLAWSNLHSTFRNAGTSRNTWKTVLPLWVYVYSAYARLNPDNTASATITVIAIVNSKSPPENVTVKCDCLYQDVLVDAEIRVLAEELYMDYTAARILCEMTRDLFQNPAFLKIGCQVGNISGSVELYVPEFPSQKRALHGFGICGPVIFGTDIQPEHVIQFTEYYGLMGAGKHILYQYEPNGIVHSYTSVDLMKVIRFYERLGRFHLEQWVLPADVDGKVHYNGQIAALNDCMLKVAGYWSNAVVVDFDEYIISRNGAGLQWIMKDKDADCLIIHSAVARSPPVGLPESRFRRISRNITRESYVWPAYQRSKYICRPEKVISAGIHFALESRPNSTELVADPSETLVLHFSGASVPQHDTLVSLDIAHFLGHARFENYIVSVISAHRDIFNTSEIQYLTGPRI